MMHFLKRKSRVKIYKFFQNRKHAIYWEIQDFKDTWKYYYNLADRIQICLLVLIIVTMIAGIIYLIHLNNECRDKLERMATERVQPVESPIYNYHKYEEDEIKLIRRK